MPNYKNGKIYKLVCFTTGKVYIGSTTQSLAKRKGSHLADYNRWKLNKRHYCTYYEIIKNDNYRIELIENYPCNSKEELHAKEGEQQRNTDCVNKNIAGRTKQQYHIDNQESILAKKKQYRLDNVDIIKQKYEDNKEKMNLKRTEIIICECGSEIIRAYASKHRKTNKHIDFTKQKI
jgi:hypothetical protein